MIRLHFHVPSILMTIWCILPGIFLTLPFGRLADEWGRKPVMILGLGGQVSAYLWVLLVCEYATTSRLITANSSSAQTISMKFFRSKQSGHQPCFWR